MRIGKMIGATAAIVACAGTFGAPAGAQVLRGFEEPGQPLASGQTEGDAHGAIHCPTVAELFIDPSMGPSSAPGSVVITPNRTLLGGPRTGVCADIYAFITGQA
jgi:hypothetical protein